MDKTPLHKQGYGVEARGCIMRVRTWRQGKKEAVEVPARCICDWFLILIFHIYCISIQSTFQKSLQECLAVQIKILIADPHNLQQLTIVDDGSHNSRIPHSPPHNHLSSARHLLGLW